LKKFNDFSEKKSPKIQQFAKNKNPDEKGCLIFPFAQYPNLAKSAYGCCHLSYITRLEIK
jgi:hypothetical protein